jgi:hypothetical protein
MNNCALTFVPPTTRHHTTLNHPLQRGFPAWSHVLSTSYSLQLYLGTIKLEFFPRKTFQPTVL